MRAVEIDRAGAVVASLALERESPGDPVSAADCGRLVGAMRRAGVLGSSACVTVPKTMLRTTTIELPPLDSGAPIAVIARAEIARVLGMDAGSFEFMLWAPRDAEENAGARPMAVVCPHTAAGPVLTALSECGVEACRFVPCGAGIAAEQGGDGTISLVLDVGWTSASFYVVGSGAVQFERSIRALGFGGVASELAADLDLPLSLGAWCGGLGRQESQLIALAAGKTLHRYGQRLAEEVGSSIAYARRCWPDAPHDVLRLAGGGGADPELCEWLGVNLGVMVEPIGAAMAGPSGGPAFAAARGAAKLARLQGALDLTGVAA